MSTVPIFAPDGSFGEVPYEQMKAAIAAGGKPAIRFKSPEGKEGYIPADQTATAVKGGGQMLPIEQQDKGIPEYYGFTPKNVARNAWEGFKGTIAGVGSLAKDLAANPNWVFGEESTLKKFVADPMHQQAAKAVDAFNKGNYSEAFGHAVASGVPVVGPVAGQLGEQAGSGDVGGAAGQAAGMAAGAKTIDVAAKAVTATPGGVRAGLATPTGEAALAATKAAAKKLPASLVRRVPYVGDVAVDVYKAATKAAANAKLDATRENTPYAGEVEPPPTSVAAPAPPVAAAATPVPAAAAQAPAAAPKITPAALEAQLTEALGGQKPVKPVPGVTIKNQPAAQAAARGKLPEGFTPVKSSVLKGYKYDTSTQQFESVTSTGQHYVTGEITPEQVEKFEAADSKGTAWNTLRSNGTPLGKKINGKLVPYKRAGLRTGAPEAAEIQSPAATPAAPEDDLLNLLQQSLDTVKQKRALSALK